jgi:hypothetical protein
MRIPKLFFFWFLFFFYLNSLSKRNERKLTSACTSLYETNLLSRRGQERDSLLLLWWWWWSKLLGVVVSFSATEFHFRCWPFLHFVPSQSLLAMNTVAKSKMHYLSVSGQTLQLPKQLLLLLFLVLLLLLSCCFSDSPGVQEQLWGIQ